MEVQALANRLYVVTAPHHTTQYRTYHTRPERRHNIYAALCLHQAIASAKIKSRQHLREQRSLGFISI